MTEPAVRPQDVIARALADELGAPANDPLLREEAYVIVAALERAGFSFIRWQPSYAAAATHTFSVGCAGHHGIGEACP